MSTESILKDTSITFLESYLNNASPTGYESEGQKLSNHLILLAKNFTGYKNLMKIISVSHLEGYYYKPRIDTELIEKYNDNLVCILLRWYIHDYLP